MDYIALLSVKKANISLVTLTCVAVDVCTAASLQSPLSWEFMLAVEDSSSKDIDATAMESSFDARMGCSPKHENDISSVSRRSRKTMACDYGRDQVGSSGW
jgi:hypothetical protein